ncbi:UPF0182 family protein [Patescibacteria group bacterium]|nr:UPF0182 family protein [Patescibacteria group bacterium]
MLSKRYIVYIVGGLVLLVVSALFGLFRQLTDWFWFKEIGFSSIFFTILGTQVLWGLAVGLVSFIMIYGNLWLAGKLATKPMTIRMSVAPRLQRGELMGGGGEVKLVEVEQYVPKIILLVSLVFGLLIGLAGAGSWEIVLKYVNAVEFNSVDPIFGRDLSFYVFELPLIQFLIGLGLWLVLLTLIGVVISYVLRGAVVLPLTARGVKALKFLHIDKEANVHLSILAAGFFVFMAARIYFIRMPSLLYSVTGTFTGASFADINALLPYYKILMFVAVVAAGLTVVNIFRPSRRFIGLAVGIYFVVTILGGWIYPTFLQRFVVLPNELVKETPYIKRNIEATKKAFALDNVTERNLTGEAALTMADIDNNRSTIKNVRLWDREPLLNTFSQLQEIRTYYDFGSIDNDRYRLNGDYRQVLLAPRELDSTSLPQRTFINERLTFTHGYGLTLSPVNEVTPEGLPVLFLKDLPPASDIEALAVHRPEIYYGEQASDWVVVNTKTQEFDYPSGEGNVYVNYSGSGGVPVNSLFRKALFALRFKSLKLLLSGDITAESRIMFYRNIEERVQRVVPFLSLDKDPYIVVTQDGRLKWIYDAYTTSNRYPYAEMVSDVFSPLAGRRINYIRNSVKVVIDAYDGSMTFYVVDKEDPIIQVYANIFKDLFLSGEEMSDDIRSHIRYPEDLFTYQTNLYATYHMDETQVFYNKEDQWQIPRVTSGAQADPMMRHMIMKLPGEEREEFILMIPFTPRGKDNLAAWMVARNDGDLLGQLVVYRFPKQKLVFGPTQINNRINQDADISRQISLWDQRGSEVIRGNLLVIPIEESLIYVQPIYLQAEGGKIPELKRVIVAYENRIAMAETLDLALNKVFGGSQAAEQTDEAGLPGIEGVPTGPAIQQAKELFNRAMQAQRSGNWALYGDEISKLGEVLERE